MAGISGGFTSQDEFDIPDSVKGERVVCDPDLSSKWSDEVEWSDSALACIATSWKLVAMRISQFIFEPTAFVCEVSVSRRPTRLQRGDDYFSGC